MNRRTDAEPCESLAPALAPDDPALKLWVILSRAHAAVSAHAAADASGYGLTLTEFAILEALYHKGPMLLREVQKKILVSSGGITFLVDRLAEKGLVERRECPGDRRARFAALTTKGERLLGEIFPRHADALRRAMGGLNVAEQRSVAGALRKLGVHANALPRDGSDQARAARRSHAR